MLLVTEVTLRSWLWSQNVNVQLTPSTTAKHMVSNQSVENKK